MVLNLEIFEVKTENLLLKKNLIYVDSYNFFEDSQNINYLSLKSSRQKTKTFERIAHRFAYDVTRIIKDI